MAGTEDDGNFDPEKCCSVCGILENLKRCGKCLNTWYCGREHQLQDWKNHKAECRKLQRNSLISEGPKSFDTVAVNGDDRINANSASGAVGDDANLQTRTSTNQHNNALDDGKAFTNASSEDVRPKVPKQKKKSKKSKGKSKSTSSATNDHHDHRHHHHDGTPENLNNQAGKSSETVKAKDSAFVTNENKTETKVKPSSPHDKKYDPRPFRRIQFPILKDRSIDSLTKHIVEYLHKDSKCIVDDLLPINAALAIKAEVEALQERGSFVDGPLSGGKASSDNSKKYSEKSIRSDKITWLNGKEPDYPNICQYMKYLDNVVLKLNGCLEEECQINGRTKAMVACYPGNGTGYAYHVDNPNKDGRVLTFLYYLNEGWAAETLGGNLRIFTSDGGYVDIEPILNRLLVFWSDRRNPHEVQPAWASRFAITMWYFDKDEREAARAAQLNEEIGAVKNNLAQVELKTKATEKASVEKEIEKQSLGAVGSLSDDELEAMAVLLEGSPDPRQTLTEMKVVPAIQDVLLSHLEERKKHKTTISSSSAS